MNRKPGEDQFSLFAAEALSEPASRDESPKRPQGARKPTGGLSHTAKRLIDTSAEIALSDPKQLTFQHTVLCQTALPYRSLDSRLWQRRNGHVELEVEAGRVRDTTRNKWVPVPLPYGPRARLILMHLNREALRTQSRVVETDDSLTAFVRHLLGRAPNSRDISVFKSQLTQLSAAQIRLAMAYGDRAVQVNTQIVTAMDLWAPSDPAQRVMWPSTIKLGAEYFESLIEHAVPLDERAVAALAHSAVALDIYTWLAQRLHRIPPRQEDFIAWPVLHEQFGGGYKRIRAFRAFFTQQLRAVHTQYPEARIESDREGVRLRHSPPPVGARLITGPGTTRP